MIIEGNISSDGAFQMAYGLYLLGGGTPEGFQSLTSDDVQTLLSTHNAIQNKFRNTLLRDIAKMFGAHEE